MPRCLTSSRAMLGAVALLSLCALAACSAVQQVKTGMEHDWQETFGEEGQSVQKPPARRPSANGAARKTAPAESTELAALRKQAKTGDAEAEYALGLRHDQGSGVARDPATALQWYRIAAEHGHALAALNAALIYDSASGVPRDAVAAAFWYRKAAEAGNGRAAYNLGQLHEDGDGVAQDERQALVWYRAARKAGLAAAADKTRKLEAALAPRTPPPAARRLAAASDGRQIAQADDDPTPSALPIPQRAGETPALQLALAGKPAGDAAETVGLIRAAAEKGHPQAACELGLRYIDGRGVPRDLTQATQWLRRAATRDFAPAQTSLGILLTDDDLAGRSDGEALMWISKAAAAGYNPAKAQLGMMYAAGRGVPQDNQMAAFWLTAARRNAADLRGPSAISCGPQS